MIASPRKSAPRQHREGLGFGSAPLSAHPESASLAHFASVGLGASSRGARLAARTFPSSRSRSEYRSVGAAGDANPVGYVVPAIMLALPSPSTRPARAPPRVAALVAPPPHLHRG